MSRSKLLQQTRLAAAFSRGYATPSGPSALLFLEHRAGKLNPASLNALTAASQLGGQVTGIVTGGEEDDVAKVAESVKNLPMDSILHFKQANLSHSLAEPVAPFLAGLMKKGGYTHLVAAHTAVGKNVFPRVAALLDVAQISDVMKVDGLDTFVRPIYAGNAIQTVKSSDAIKIFTVRTASFEPAQAGDKSASISAAEVNEQPASEDSKKTEWMEEKLTKSERPDLGSAQKVVSGGRGVKNKENFDNIMTPLADALGAAIGASRAAVDSGYADNSLQVGQTGKVVAPELYLAVGISGAIQHLAGMKDSKIIAAINKDADAPIMTVADYGLVADLFDAVPELTQKLGK